MNKVRSIKSRVCIPLNKFADASSVLKKRFIENESMQSAPTLHALFKECGWSSRINLQNKNIRELRYSADSWTALAHSAITVIARFVEPGGFIQLIDDDLTHFWVYKFNGKTVSRKELTRIFSDLSSAEDALLLFKKATSAVISNGLDRHQLHKIIDESLVSEIFD